MTAFAAEALDGVWRRLRLRAPGVEDVTTEVWWFQADGLHVDLRLPEGRAALPATLAACSADQLRALAAAEGFAGETGLKQNVCTWTRRINWRGPVDGPDAGTLEETAEGLVETGVFAEYDELWTLETPGPAQARRLSGPGGRLAVVVRAGDRFALGRGAPEAMAGPPLAERLETALAARHRGALERLFDMEFCWGRLAEAGPVIARSTLPGRAGDLAWRGDPFGGGEVSLPIRGWDGSAREEVWRAA